MKFNHSFHLIELTVLLVLHPYLIVLTSLNALIDDVFALLGFPMKIKTHSCDNIYKPCLMCSKMISLLVKNELYNKHHPSFCFSLDGNTNILPVFVRADSKDRPNE